MTGRTVDHKGPRAERMPWPDYEPTREGARLLTWDWALERIGQSRRLWLATTRPDGAPYLTAVWAVWVGEALAFSTGRRTRKARNLAAQPRCALSTESAGEAVVIQGSAREVTDDTALAQVDRAYVAKYGSSALIGDSPVFLVRPIVAIGLVDGDASVLPTRWRFDA